MSLPAVHPARTAPVRARMASAGFSLLEVMIAAAVLALAIVTAITTLQRGLQAVDTARNTTSASQVMENEMERLRLRSWTQLQALQDAGVTAVSFDSSAVSGGRPFTCRRSIRDVKADMKEITLSSTWYGYDGRPHTLRLVTRYARTGLYDYLYTAH